jgi:outer membrane lipoprotein carrier protein
VGLPLRFAQVHGHHAAEGASEVGEPEKDDGRSAKEEGRSLTISSFFVLEPSAIAHRPSSFLARPLPAQRRIPLPTMKTLFSLLASGLLLATSLHAQDDPKSKAIMDKLIAKNKTYTSFEADFSSRLVNTASKLDVKQDGNVKVKGKKFRLVLPDNTVINDGTVLWAYSKKSNEVTLNDPAEMDQELDPSKLFTVYEKGFKSQFIDEKADATGIVVQTIKLFPLDPAKKPYHTVILGIDKNKMEPRTVQVLYKDGNVVTYTLKKFTPNPELAETNFMFDKSKYPGVELNDMR